MHSFDDVDSSDDGVSLNDPLPEDPRLTKLRAEGWTDVDLPYRATFCGPCGNAGGLMTRNGEVQCRGCLIWGHPSFAEV